MDISLTNYMYEQLDLVDLSFKRYMYNKLPWKERLVGLTGPRGVGKSTIIMQHIKEMSEEDQKKTLYVSADHSYFTVHTLIELASQFVREGGEWLFIDEVHKYNGWSKELKQIYDSHPALHTFFTGSSVLDILEGEADLSRRSLLFNMQGLSFREYLELFHNIKTPVRTLEDVLMVGLGLMGCSIQYLSSIIIYVRVIFRSPKRGMYCNVFSKLYALLWRWTFRSMLICRLQQVRSCVVC